MKEKEKEYTFYARITDFKGLDNAEKYEYQEQYTFLMDNKQMRVRAITVANDTQYEFTIKIKHDDDDRTEYNARATREMFLLFKKLSTDSMRKFRYYFPVIHVENDQNPNQEENNLYFEVDVFLKPDGGLQEWCKIDLEVQELEKDISGKYKLNVSLKNIPLGLTDVMTNTNADEETKAKISELYQTVFTK